MSADAHVDQAVVLAGELEAWSRGKFETNVNPLERKAFEEVMRNAKGLQVALRRLVQTRVLSGS